MCLHASGQGCEPQIIFDKSLVEFQPILPFSNGSEAEVTITNPLEYPVEIYSLEFDKQYLQEEEVRERPDVNNLKLLSNNRL